MADASARLEEGTEEGKRRSTVLRAAGQCVCESVPLRAERLARLHLVSKRDNAIARAHCVEKSAANTVNSLRGYA